jgi:hypothetical protein
MLSQDAAPRIEIWSIQKLVFYAKNPRKNDAAVDLSVVRTGSELIKTLINIFRCE